MIIVDDPNNFQKRFKGKIAGLKGAGYAEVLPNEKIETFLMENKSNLNTKIIIYTDGSSKGNPGPGGWGAIIIYNDEISNSQFSISKIKEIGGREETTTNNRMEMRAAIEGLKSVSESIADTEETEVEIHTDSEYLINGITKWIHGWQKNNWRTKDKREVLNRDLWQELFEETEKRKVEWKKVLGHSGHALNERCDEIAQSFADGKNMALYNGPRSNYKMFH